jgi:YgiT-type zinc finger domain-containing protein
MTGSAQCPTNPSPSRPAEVEAALATWRQTHPAATLGEIERVVDEILSSYRAALITTAAAAAPGIRPECPTCGRPLQRVGQRTRHVRTAHGGELTFTEPAYRCPACGTGVFPPD